jgi:hypothetical protein
MVEKQRDDALGTVKALTEKVEQLTINNFKMNELRGMPIQKLKSLQVNFLTFIDSNRRQLMKKIYFFYKIVKTKK